MLCHFGQAWDGSVAIHFCFQGSTATNSATADYTAVSERLGQNEERAGSNKERSRKKLSFVPEVYLFDAVESFVFFSPVLMIFL